MKFIRIILLYFLINVNPVLGSLPDSLTIKYDSVKNIKDNEIILSASVTQQKYLDETTINILTFSAKINSSNAIFFEKHRSKKEITFNYSYTHYIDSLWIKTNDQFYFSYNWSKNNNVLSSSFILNYKTQLTNTEIRNRTGSKLIGQFGFPSILNLGIGLNYQLKSVNYLHFSLLNLQETLISSNLILNRSEFKKLTPDLEFQQQLGFSLVSSLKFRLTKKLTWRNNSKMFFRGLKRDDLNFDIRNQFIIDIYKKVKLCLDSRVFFNPLIQSKIQMSNEILLGIGLNRSPIFD